MSICQLYNSKDMEKEHTRTGWTEIRMPCQQLRLLDVSSVERAPTLDRDPQYTISLLHLQSFLCKALLFIKNIQSASVFINHVCRFSVTRARTVSKTIRLPAPVALTYLTMDSFVESEHTLTVHQQPCAEESKSHLPHTLTVQQQQRSTESKSQQPQQHQLSLRHVSATARVTLSEVHFLG